VEKLLAGLRANRLAASGLVDGGERRPLTGEEWHDFLIEVLSDQKAFQSIFPIRGLKPGSYFVAVRSLGMIPGEAVRLRIGRAMGALPSRKLVYHRFIERVLVAGNDLVREFPGTDKLSSMKTSQQIRVLMNGHRLGPEHGHHKSKVVEDIIRLFKSYGLLIRSNDTLAKAVRREYDGRRIASKLPLGSTF
jgi:hypothetical protein